MKYILTLSLILNALAVGNTQIITESQFSIGNSIEFKSTILDEERILNVYLPESYYGDSIKKYPVIYLLDGSRDEDFIHVSGLVQFCSFSWIGIIEESIVVGISNVDRKRDFTYPSDNTLDQSEFPTSGKSEKFIRFLGEELQPLIKDKYRTTDEKTIIGQSLGGLLATEIVLKYPHMYENYIIVSPSLWWDDEKLLGIASNTEKLKGKSIYIAGGKEGAIMERLAKSLYFKLSIENKNEIYLHYNYFEQQNHGDALHLAVYDAFEKIFKKDK